MTRQKRSKRTWTKWRKLVSQQAKSSESVAEFCRKRGLCAPHFYAWKKRLNGAGRETNPFVEVRVAPATTIATATGAAIEVRLSNGRGLLVEPGFEANHLRALVAILESQA